MYLDVLNDKEKELFLSFAYNLSAADKDFSPEERMLISSCCREMGIDFDMSKINLSIDETMEQINSLCSSQVKKIIIFEAIRLAIVDTEYDEDERKIILTAIEKFGIEKSYHDACEDILNEFFNLENKISGLVSEEE